jgi:aminodeoxyfutalosine deaminase
VKLGAVPTLAEHPLPAFVRAGIRCSISSDDPAFLDTDLTRNCEAASSLGVSPRTVFEAGVAGALCDDATRATVSGIGAAFDWSRIEPSA